MEQISPAEADAAFMHYYLTLSCSSYRIRGTALVWELRGGSCLHLHVVCLALGVLVLNRSQQSREEEEEQDQA